jgi:pentatricopeptide repeat protein
VLSNNALARGPSLSPLSLDDQRASNSPLFQHHQVRWKRKGGASAFSEPRPPTRKQRKAYNRRKAKLYHEKQGKHSAPGSKAGYRRQWNEETFQQLLDYNSKNELMEKARLEYDYGDAMVDDLMGNTAGYTSLPTPKPFFLGHRHKKYYNQVRREMERYREGLEKLEESNNDEGLSTNLLPPSDHDISLVLRAYRDRHGTKTKPIGIVKALKHLLTDLSLNTALFGEETYTTLLTCCQTPAEARRIFKLMREQQHPISSYSWAILVDIHAKLGDFEGCNEVMNEMVAEGGLIPSLPAYTSLLAACYKVVNNGTIPHSIRDKAAKLGWNRWKEMFISDIEPDAMAYGALLRLIGARGQPERAINILQEMQSKGVKPTTLCFTSALKAVSRSQQTAVRFERGSSKKQKRREQITAHHGKLARQIVILAENAEVKQDDGFVAALMLCAGAAGDSATAKAILLASEVRKMNHLRTIGPDDHLRQIRGESTPREATPVLNDGLEMEELLDGAASLDSTKYSSSSALETRGQDGTVAKSSNRKKRYPSFEEREYGADSRKLSALLFACSQAVDSHSLGMQWAGRYNKGYLDENSLRLITTRPQPKYFNPAIPGVSSTEVGMGSIAWQDEEPEHLSKSLRRAKYRGINQDDSVGHTMEDIDDTFFNMFKDDYKEKMDNIPEVDPMLLNKEEWEALKEAKTAGALRERMQQKSKQDSSPIQEATYRESDEEWYFDDDSRKWKARKRTVGSSILTSVHPDERKEEVSGTANDVAKSDAAVDNGEEETEMYFDDTTRKWKTRPKLKQSVVRNDVADDSEESELYFDEDARRWKTRPKSMAKPGKVESPSALVST